MGRNNCILINDEIRGCRLYLSITDERLWKLLKWHMQTNLSSRSSQVLDTEVGERGVKLLGGQRQRIAIARAFLRNPKILIIDEATARLDSQSENVVQEALSRLMEGHTTFIIAHRLSTVVDVDKIIFIKKREVTSIGTHQELIVSQHLYRTFCGTTTSIDIANDFSTIDALLCGELSIFFMGNSRGGDMI